MSTIPITVAERAERERQVAQALHAGEMEGLVVTEATKADVDSYVAGDIDLLELDARVRARYRLS